MKNLQTRTDLINYLIEKYNFKTYLEIGLDDGYNYKRINCENKESVDPYFEQDHNKHDFTFSGELPYEILSILTYRLTSDDFFDANENNYDLIFLDGLHTEEQIGKDVVNAMKCLNENGFIIVHDCLPRSYEATITPRIQTEWNGTVWKGIVELTKQGLDIKVWDKDYGVAIIRKTNDENLLHLPKKCEHSWDEFVNKRNELLNVINTETLMRIF